MTALTTSLVLALGIVCAPAATADDECTIAKKTSTSTVTLCAQPSSLTGQNFVSIWRDSVSNLTPQPISATCKATTRGTVSFSYSFTGSAKIKAWVFADVSAEVSGGIKASVSTGIDVSSTFSIPGFRVVNCDRGIVRQNFSSRIKETTTHSGRAPQIRVLAHSGFAPVRAQWLIKQL